MRGFEAAARDFREHGRKEQRVGVAHERDLDAAVERVRAFERACRRMPREAAPDDDDPSADRRYHTRPTVREPTRGENGIYDRPNDEAEKHPTDERGKRRAQPDGAPLCATSAEEREQDDAGDDPRCDANGRAGGRPVQPRTTRFEHVRRDIEQRADRAIFDGMRPIAEPGSDGARVIPPESECGSRI